MPDEKRQCYYAHGLLSVVGSVAGGHKGRRQDLEPSERFVDFAGMRIAESPGQSQHHQVTGHESRERRKSQRHDDFIEYGGKLQSFRSPVGNSRAHQTADEGMGGGRRQSQVPGQEVPCDCTAERRQCQGLAAPYHFRLNDAASDRLGNMSADECPEQVEQCRHHHRGSR